MKFSNILKNKYLFVIFVCIQGLFFFLPVLSDENKEELNNRERSKILNKLISEKANKLAKQYNMQQIGTTVGMPDGIIELLGASFQKETASLEEARTIVIDGCLKFLKTINSNEQLKPYLIHYPFTIKNVELTVYFDSNNYDSEANTLSVVSCFGGNIYFFYKKKNERYGYSKEIKESFEEAM